jgi:PIN domain nuclease of toxin-antitoxin system
MKSLLLDSHTLLWYENEPELLSGHVHKAMRGTSTEIFVSPVSVYELGLKVAKQQLPHAQDMFDDLQLHLKIYGFKMLPFDERHALRAARLPWPHRDPFDRMLAAQAIEESMILVTKDKVFKTLRELTTLW